MVTILIIDDKEDNLVSISALLKNFISDCSAITADSGAKGIERARAEQPDAILLDIIMPGMDGYEVCRKLKSDEKTKHIPVIMVTAIKTDSQSRVKGLDIGADAFLSKPIDEAELTAQVNVVLRIKKAEDLLRKERNLLEEIVEERTRALMASEERFNLAINATLDGVWDWNIVTNEEDFSPRWCEILGYSHDDPELPHTYDSWASRIHPDDNVSVTAALKGHLEEGKPYHVDYRHHHKSGEYRWQNSRGQAIFDENGKPVRMVGCIRDITERKALEAKLQQAHKMAAIGTLAGGIAHDFNNILGIIMGCTELSLHDIPEETPIREYLTEALKATNRAKDMVKQILTFSRQGEQDEIPLAMGTIIKEALKMLRASLPTTIEIKQDIQRDSGLIMADPTQIHQVIMNLATNASHAMGENGGVLNVSVANIEIDDPSEQQHPDLTSGSYIKLTVSDTGHGMEPGVMEQIFDPYYTTKEIGKGTGLGLSVVHGIVLSHEGVIDVSSEPGKGTTFELFFPKVDLGEARTEISVKENIPRGNERILFVDDEPAMAQIYQSMLERLGYTVSTRTSSIEALEAFKAQPDKYDLIVTDQTMPHMTGQMLAKEMIAIRPGIPIVLCTGHSDLINADKAIKMGIQAFVMKPIAMGEIARTIRGVLDRKETTNEDPDCRG